MANFAGLFSNNAPAQAPTTSKFSGIFSAPANTSTPAPAKVSNPSPNINGVPAGSTLPATAFTGNLGGGYGTSNVTDPASGKPLLTFENTKTQSSQLLSDRTAPTFDPTIAQKVDPSILQDPRMQESVSQSIKKAIGGTNYQELDHIMPLELGGSNNKSNLRLEAGQNPLVPYGASNPTPTDPLENSLASQVHSGKISLVDGWKLMAQAKGMTLPEQGGTVPNINQTQNNKDGAPPPITQPETDQQKANDAFYAAHPQFKGSTISQGTGGNINTPAQQEVASENAISSLDNEGQKINIPFGPSITVPLGGLYGFTKGIIELPEKIVNDVKDTIGVLSGHGNDVVNNATSERVPSYVGDMISTVTAAKNAGLDDNQALIAGMLQGFGSGVLDVSILGDVLGKGAQAIVDNTRQDLNTISAWQTLGEPSSLDEAHVNYRSMAHDAHPDMPTGNTEKMTQLNQAYDTLKANGIPSKVKSTLNNIFSRFSEPLNQGAAAIDTIKNNPKLLENPELKSNPTLEDFTQKEVTTPSEQPKTEVPVSPAEPSETAIAPKESSVPDTSRAGFVNPSEAMQGIKETATNVKTAIEHAHATHVASENIDEGMRTLSNQNRSDEMRLASAYKNADLTPKEEQNIYTAREEGTTESLTPKEKAANDQIITPLKDEQARIINKLKDRGITSDESHNSRIVLERNGFFDKLTQGMKGGKTGGGLLSKSTGSLKRRVMLGAVDGDGNRIVISTKRGVITKWDNGTPTTIGKYGSVKNLTEGKTFEGKNGKTYKITQATTREIESNTNLKYSHYALANEMIATQKLLSAERASDWLESFKEDPDFGKIAVKVGKGNIPDGYKMTDSPYFRGYAFEPEVADAIDRYFNTTNDDGLLKIQKISLYVRNVSLFNPFYHGVVNVAPNWAAAKGAVGLLNPMQFPKGAKAGAYAIRAIINPLTSPAEGMPSYTDLLDHNMTLTSSHTQATLGDAIKKRVGTDLQRTLGKNPKIWDEMANALGWANPVKWTDYLIGRKGISFKAAMISEDVARLQVVYQAIENGSSIDDAVKKLDTIFPTNRISEGQFAVANKLVGKQITKGVTSPTVTIFAGYHASLWQTLYNNVKTLMGRLPEGGSKKEAADRIAGLLIGLTILYPAYDAILKKITGDPNAVAKRGGVFAVLYNIEQLLKGKEDAQTFTQSTFTPNPVTEAIIETALNRDFFTGNQVVPQGTQANPITEGEGFMNEVGSNVSAAQNASQIASGKKALSTYLYSLVGISIPKSTPSIVNINSLIYDQKPQIDTQVKAAVASGNTAQAKKLIDGYNKQLLDNMVDALIETKPVSGGILSSIVRQVKVESGILVGSTKALRTQLWTDPKLKSDFLYMPSAKVMQNYKATQGKTSVQKLGL